MHRMRIKGGKGMNRGSETKREKVVEEWRNVGNADKRKRTEGD